MPRLTQHARERWQERFGQFNLEQEFDQAVPFSGQLGSNQSLIAPCGAVFILAPNQNIKTVLTREQALGNVQARMPVYRQHQSVQALQSSVPASPGASLEELAAEHARRFPNHDHRRTRNKELQAAGHDPSNQRLQAKYQDLYWAEIRKLKAPTEIL